MITDLLFNFFYSIFKVFIDGHEPLRFNVDSSVYEVCKNFISFVFYILPVYGLKPIVFIIASIIMFRITVSLIKTLWDVLPIL